nr:hypothetical protein CFP56_02630 [Quercus suber]
MYAVLPLSLAQGSISSRHENERADLVIHVGKVGIATQMEYGQWYTFLCMGHYRLVDLILPLPLRWLSEVIIMIGAKSLCRWNCGRGIRRRFTEPSMRGVFIEVQQAQGLESRNFQSGSRSYDDSLVLALRPWFHFDC